MIHRDRRLDLLIVVPPQASTMANGPPLGPLLLDYFLRDDALGIDVFDANAFFHHWMLRPTTRQLVRDHWRTRVDDALSRSELSRSELSEVGRAITWLASSYCQGRQFDALRAGFEWLPAQTMLSETPAGEAKRREAILEIVQEIEAAAPLNLAFTVMFHEQRRALLDICKLLRGRGFAGKILIGGALIKLSSDEQLSRDLREGGIDLAFRFNLYGPQPELAAWLRGHAGAEQVPHASFLTEGQLRHASGVACRAKKLAGALAYDLVPARGYVREWIYPVLLSEGCYWGKCDFCDYPYLASRDPFVVSALFRDPMSVRQDVLAIHDSFGVQDIDLISDAVPMGYFPRLARAAGEELRARGIRLSCSIRAEPKARPEHFFAMRDAGVNEVTIGVEALSDAVLTGMKKGNSYADIVRAMRMAKDAGIHIKANLIFDHPRLQLEHVSETLERLQEITEYVDSLGIHSFALSPHAPIAHEAESAGLVVLRRNAKTDHGDHHLGFERKHHPEALTQALAKLKSTLDAVSFQLDLKRGAFSQDHTFGLPLRWEAERAVATTSDPNVFIRIPGEKAAFSFFCVDSPETVPSAP